MFNQSYQLRLKKELLLCRDNHFKDLKDEYLKVFSSIKAIGIALSNLGCFEVRHKQTGKVNLRAMAVNVQELQNTFIKISSECH